MNTTSKTSADNRNTQSAQKRATAIQALIVSRRLRAYARQRALSSRAPATLR